MAKYHLKICLMGRSDKSETISKYRKEIVELELLNVLATVMAIIFATILSFFLVRRSEQKALKMEKYQRFYLPYIVMIYKGMTMADFSSYVPERQAEFIKFLDDNIMYASQPLQKKIFSFYHGFGRSILLSPKTQENEFYSPKMDEAWRNINAEIISEYEFLCGELGYAPLTLVHR